MVARFRSWWQKIKQHRGAIGVVAIVLIVAIALIITLVWFNGTGFNGYNKITVAHTISGTNTGTVIRTEEYQPGKTLWDWLQLLIIPLALAVVALLFNRANTRTEQKIAKERYEQDRQIAAQRYEQDQKLALDRQREDLLHIYLDRMSELLLDKKLRTSEHDAEVRNVARVRTITILFQLDARRIDYVFAFLREAGLISNKPNSSIVSLSHADLDRINLSRADLSKTDLSGTTFMRANLSEANLSDANLSDANFFATNLSFARLSGADLSYANLLNTNLRGAGLVRANLKEAFLFKANLKGAFLEEADLSGAEMSGADMSGADGTTPEQLAKAKSLKDAIMPDGSIHP